MRSERWANKDFDRRLEKVAVLEDFLEDNADDLSAYGIDVADLAGTLDAEHARTILEIVTDHPNEAWVI